MSNPRDHGYGDSPQVRGAPVVGDKLAGPCPMCGCVTLFSIEAEIANPSPRLARPSVPHRVVGRYVGCAACPWASPMVSTCVVLP